MRIYQVTLAIPMKIIFFFFLFTKNNLYQDLELFILKNKNQFRTFSIVFEDLDPFINICSLFPNFLIISYVKNIHVYTLRLSKVILN
jgi:hypothetical protein